MSPSPRLSSLHSVSGVGSQAQTHSPYDGTFSISKRSMLIILGSVTLLSVTFVLSSQPVKSLRHLCSTSSSLSSSSPSSSDTTSDGYGRPYWPARVRFAEQIQRERQENIPHCSERILNRNSEVVYFRRQKVLLFTMAKSGTSTLFHWIYKLLSGFPTGWDMKACATYVQNPYAACWNDSMVPFYKLSPSKQQKIYEDQNVLKVAVQRDAFARLVSSFKSKYTCETQRFKTDVSRQDRMVNVLKSRAGLKDVPLANDTHVCMNISEFAQALSSAQKRFNNNIIKLRALDVHIRPQLYCFHEVQFDMIIDVKDLSQESVMFPIYERFKSDNFHINMSVPKRRHTSTGSEGLGLLMPAKAATQLFNFAKLSQPAPLKYLAGALPVQEEESQDYGDGGDDEDGGS